MSLRTRPRRGLLLFAAAIASAAPIASAPAASPTPPPVTVTAAVRVPALNNWSVGTAQVAVEYLVDGYATATVTAPSILLGKGHQFRLTTCLTMHNLGTFPASACVHKAIDTRANKTAVAYAAPPIRRTWARPKAGRSGYAAYQVEAAARDASGKYPVAATSWPVNGFRAATVGIAAQGAVTASAPASQGVPWPWRLTDSGGINSGLPDSTCTASVLPATTSVPPGLSTSALGALPAAYEVGEPSGAFAAQPPKGVVIIIHGGGWYAVGPGGIETARPDADRWRARGWRTVNTTYRACGQSVVDVFAVFDRVRATWPTIPVCTSGASAGGWLALNVAAARPETKCVVSLATPTDPVAMENEFPQSQPGAYTPGYGAPWLYGLMVAAFGEELLPYTVIGMSPVRARILAGIAENDWAVPVAQLDDLRANVLRTNPVADVDAVMLAPGTQPFPHGRVSQAALDDFRAREDALAAAVAGG